MARYLFIKTSRLKSGILNINQLDNKQQKPAIHRIFAALFTHP